MCCSQEKNPIVHNVNSLLKHDFNNQKLFLFACINLYKMFYLKTILSNYSVAILNFANI